MRSSTLDVRTPDGVVDAYLTRPDDGERHPGVLYVMDAYGLRPRIEEMADRIARRGYAVLAPNVLYRAGRAPVLPFPDMTQEGARVQFFKEVRPLMDQLTRRGSPPTAVVTSTSSPRWPRSHLRSPAIAWALEWLARRGGVSRPDRGTRLLSRRRPRRRRCAEPAPVGRRPTRRGILRSRRPGPEQQRRADRHP